MPDSTRELLDAHHAAVLRELNQIHTSIGHSLAAMREDMGEIKGKLDDHGAEDNRRFGDLDNSMGVLKWAYGVGVIIVAAIFALLKLS